MTDYPSSLRDLSRREDRTTTKDSTANVLKIPPQHLLYSYLSAGQLQSPPLNSVAFRDK